MLCLGTKVNPAPVFINQAMDYNLQVEALFFKYLRVERGTLRVKRLYQESEALEAARPIGAGAYPGFCSMKRLEVFLLPLDGMLVHRRPLPRKLSGFPQQFAGTHLIGERYSESKVSCLRTQHNVPGQGSNPDRSLRSRAH